MENSKDITEKIYRLGDLIEIIEPEGVEPGSKGTDKNCLSLNDFTAQYMLSYVTLKKMGNANYLVGSHIGCTCMMAALANNQFVVARLSTLAGMEDGIWIDRIPYFAFRIKNHNLVSEDFLLRALVSDSTSVQLEKLAKKDEYAQNIYDLIEENELLSIEIGLPELQEQDLLVKKDMLALLQHLMSEKQEDFDKYQKDIHLKKHAVGQTIFNLNNWWNTLQNARKEGNGILKDDNTTGRIRPIVVSDIYKRIGESLNILSNQISTFTIGDGMECEHIALAPFISEYIATHQSPMFKFEFDETGKYATESFKIESENVLHKGDPLLYLYFPKEALTQIFDNIVSNACSHGFLGMEDENNTIRIRYSAKGGTCTLIVDNNGKPLKKGMSEEKVFMYGGSTAVGTDGHNGLGAFQIKNLMSRFSGAANIECNEEADFPFGYRLTFNNCISY